jgi:hypothetical protein
MATANLGRKGAGTRGKGATPKSIDPAKAIIADLYKCGQCKDEVREDESSIECHRCRSWFHRACSDLNESEFKLLTKGKESIVWTCMTCLQNKGEETKKFLQIENRLERLMNMMEGMEERIMQKIEDRIEKRIDEKVDEIERKLEAKMEMKLEEEAEKERRKNNIIISNIPESLETDPEKKKEEDAETVRRLLNVINPTSREDESNIFRMGKPEFGTRARPRKIKVTIANNDIKMNLMRKQKCANEKRPQKLHLPKS